jgi:hypothetical protein
MTRAPYDPDLYTAIGKVAVTSAALEQELRYTLDDLAGHLSDETWILFEGQSADWLTQSCRSILRLVDGGGHFHWERDHRERLLQILNESDELRRRRNVVIHGMVGESCFSRNDPDSDCIVRPSGAPEDSRIYFFVRSNQRRAFQEVHLAVVDIEMLAQNIEELTSRLRMTRWDVKERQKARWAQRLPAPMEPSAHQAEVPHPGTDR